MLTGRRPFRGDSHVETMNAILKEDPEEFGATGPQVPAALDRIVRRCLEKGPDERFHSAHDLGLALETLTGSGASGQTNATMAPSAAPARRKGLPWIAAAGALAVVSVGAFVAGQRFAAPSVTDEPAYHRLTYRRGQMRSAHYASDGKTIVYSAAWDGGDVRVYTTRAESPESMMLAFAKADVVSVSSSGELALVTNRRSVRAYAQVGTLARASLSGGATRAVLEDVQDADWLPDGSGFAAARYVDSRYRLEFPVGKTVYETGGYISDVRVSADGALAAFLDHPILGDDRGTVAIVDRSGVKRTLSGEYSSLQGLAWSPAGELWFTGSSGGSARSLQAVTPAGVLRTLARVPANLHLGDVGADGSALLWQENTRIGIVGRAPGEKTDRDLSWLDWSINPGISRDGRTVVFTEQGDGGGPQYSVYMRQTDGTPAVRLGAGDVMALSPDGKWVLVQRLNPAPPQFLLLPTGAGEARQVTNDALSHDTGWFTADGAHIMFAGFEGKQPPRLYLQALSGGSPKAITPEGVTGIPSPDGTLTAFRGQFYPAIGGAPTPIPGFQAGDRVVQFAAEPRTLFIARLLDSGDQQIFRLDPAGRRTPLHLIPNPPGAIGGLGFAITPDGSAFVMGYYVAQSDLFRVTGIR